VSVVVLPPLHFERSPNQSIRSYWPFSKVTGVCVHRWAVAPQTTKVGALSTYHAVVNRMCESSAQVSAHIVYGGSLVGEATQLVAWGRGAWACEAFNGCTDNIECADAIWTGQDPEGWKVAARIVAFRCHVRGIPPVWSTNPKRTPGVCRHYDLGAAGGGHTDPTEDDKLWKRFMAQVAAEHKRGGFRKVWGVN